MKLVVSFYLFFLSVSATSQTWCDAGANWKYTVQSFGLEGYTEFQYVGDTLIDGQLSNKIEKTAHTYNFINAQSQTLFFGTEFTYEANGVVYIRYNNAWDTLHNFHASIGDSWKIAKRPLTTTCDALNIQTVVDTGTMIINGIDLRFLVVEFNGFPQSTDTIIEKIGFTGGYFFREDFCDILPDANESGPFRCYTDNAFPTYKPHYSQACDFVVSVEELNPHANVRITPNPASTAIELSEVSDQDLIKIRDLNGKEWPIRRSENTIHLDALPSGVYVLSVQSFWRVKYLRFIKQ